MDREFFSNVIRTGPYAFKTYEEKFLLHCLPRPSGCIEWTGPLFPNGYGRFNVIGREFLAHRVAFLLRNGTISDDCVICHRCDNRRCVNVDHLFSGSQLDNMQDMLSKGRCNPAKGECSGMSKLSESDVRSIFDDRDAGVPAKDTANRLGIRSNHIYRILNGSRWGHLSDNLKLRNAPSMF